MYKNVEAYSQVPCPSVPQTGVNPGPDGFTTWSYLGDSYSLILQGSFGYYLLSHPCTFLISPMQLNAVIHIIHQHSYGHKADFLLQTHSCSTLLLQQKSPPYGIQCPLTGVRATQILPYNMKIITTALPLPKG